MVEITFYGGAGEIGGNMILVVDGSDRIMLDFGMSLGERGRFFSEPFLSPRNESGLINLGIIPNVPGLYKGEGEVSADAVFLSHAHIDHSMSISLLNRRIPVYCGESTKMILEALSTARPGGFENDLDGIGFKTFRTGDQLKIGRITVEPIHVDHSMPGSYGFIVHTSKGTIAYSGDFRAHGPRSDMTREFVEKAQTSDPESFLCEGTNLVRGDLQSEAGVSDKVQHVIQKTKGLILANFSTADVDRFRTFYEMAKKNGRVLAVSLRQAHLLQTLLKDKHLSIPDVSHDPNIVVYQRSKKTYYNWEREVMKNSVVKNSKDLKENQGKFVLAASSYDMNEVLDIRPDAGGAFINSSSEPFNEEMEIDHERFVNWLDHFGLPMYQIHSSGHMMPTELRETIARVNPKTLLPIHTEQPQLYGLFVKDLCEVHQPVKGETWKQE